MSSSSPNETEAFLAFARSQVATSGTDCTPEELVARWRATRQESVANGEMSALETLQQAGLIGCIDTGKGDLSTNKAHMEGFAKS